MAGRHVAAYQSARHRTGSMADVGVADAPFLLTPMGVELQRLFGHIPQCGQATRQPYAGSAIVKTAELVEV